MNKNDVEYLDLVDELERKLHYLLMQVDGGLRRVLFDELIGFMDGVLAKGTRFDNAVFGLAANLLEREVYPEEVWAYVSRHCHSKDLDRRAAISVSILYDYSPAEAGDLELFSIMNMLHSPHTTWAVVEAYTSSPELLMGHLVRYVEFLESKP